MWYWLMRFEGMLSIPPFMLYYALRGIPFFIKCRRCRSWISDQLYIRSGLCERCHREMALSEIQEFRKGCSEEAVHPVRPPHEHLYRRIVKKVGNGRILDVGCGHGYLLSRLKLQPKLFGMDVAQGEIKVAKNWVKQGDFCLADARNIPFKSNTFDYLICTEVLEHIEGNDAVKECYRILKPNGVALITVPNGKGVWGKYFTPHIRLFAFKSIMNFLSEAGFEVISGEKFGLYIPFVTRFLDAISLALDKNLPFTPILNIKVPEFLAVNFLIECRKPPI